MRFLFPGQKALGAADVTDGFSNTILIVEGPNTVAWSKPDEIEYDATKPLPKLGGDSGANLNQVWIETVAAAAGALAALVAGIRYGLLLAGLPFSFTFLSILLAHELGHFFACRYYGIRCTPPFFIPAPISIAGTLGAFIKIKSPFLNKRALSSAQLPRPSIGAPCPPTFLPPE